MAASYKVADSKREEYRKYLEKTGVIDALTKVLVMLYEEPEKPENALEFLQKHLGIAGPEGPVVEDMKLEIEQLKQQVEQLQQENADLKEKLQAATGETEAGEMTPAAHEGS